MTRFLVLTSMGLLVSGGLSGCSLLFGEDGWFPREQEVTYDQAPELDQITVPDDLDSTALESNYPIPPVLNPMLLESSDEVPRPVPLTAGAQYDAVRIQRLGEQRWALVAAPPGQLWPQVRAFLAASNINVASTDAAAGLIDTQWVKLEDRTLSTRFRFRVDSGIQRNTAELHVLQQDRSADDTGWPAASSDSELEATMLRNVAQYIANSAEAAPVSMMADRAMGDAGRIALEDDESGIRLRLDLPYDRAWASTSKGLTDAGFQIDDRNRSEGVYYVTYAGVDEEEADGGWFGWLWGSDEEDPMVGRVFRVTVTQVTERRVFIRIIGEEGEPLSRREQQGLLNLIKGNIN